MDWLWVGVGLYGGLLLIVLAWLVRDYRRLGRQ